MNTALTRNMAKNRNHTSHLNIASIVQRLPLHQHMSQSQAALVKLSPHWLTWSANNLSTDLTSQVTLSSLQNGQLVISCANAVSASQIKHQQASLLESLELNGVTSVKRIKVRIDHTYTTTDTSPIQHSSDNPINNRAVDEHANSKRQSPDRHTIKAIENCKKQITNDELAGSLERLARTLNDLDSQS